MFQRFSGMQGFGILAYDKPTVNGKHLTSHDFDGELPCDSDSEFLFLAHLSNV